MSQLVTISLQEYQALRTLAGLHLSDVIPSSEEGSIVGVDASQTGAKDHPSDEDGDPQGELQVGVDVQVDEPHPDWYSLTLNSRSMMCRLAAVYPQHIRPQDLLSRFRRTKDHPELEDSIATPSTHICHVRSSLGSDSIETVFEMRTNSKGALVRTGKCLGYRLGARYARELGLTEGDV